MDIGILALQGAVSEHTSCIEKAGMNVIEVRTPSDLQDLSGLIMPGGESTTLRNLLKNADLWKVIDKSDLPIMGTCAGAILIGKGKDETFSKINMEIDRNYYGRQRDSFEKNILMENKNKFKGIFIRAPAIISIGAKTKPIAWVNDNIVGCIEGKNMALTFHPELTDDLTFHKLWLEGL